VSTSGGGVWAVIVSACAFAILLGHPRPADLNGYAQGSILSPPPGPSRPGSSTSRLLIDRAGWGKSGAQICAELR
jgi:hypothetical protein